MSALEATIDAILPEWPPLRAAERNDVLAACIGFVRVQLGLAPFHIRAGIATMFAAFRLYAVLRCGWAPARPDRAAALQSFGALRLPPAAALERLLRSMTLLVFFDHPAVLAAIGEANGTERQAAFRARRATILKSEAA